MTTLDPTLSSISIYPIKSTAGLHLSRAYVETEGLSFDRRFMVADNNGKMITARQQPKLLRITASLLSDGLYLEYPEQPSLTLLYSDLNKQPTNGQVWGDNFQALITTEEANQWLSEILGLKAQLLYCGEQSVRTGGEIQTPVSFADAYPQLLISEASLEELNRRSTRLNTMAQFRPNLVVSNTEPFAEDGWKKIKIGDVIFEVSKPCERCIMTTAHVNTSEFDQHNEPLATLSQFRAAENGGVFFGQNLKALNQGVIKAGDAVEILETQAKPFYNDNSITKNTKPNETSKNTQPNTHRENKTVSISINNQTFTGNNQKTLLEQAEAAGLDIPNRCRAGRCGTCKINLLEGSVSHKENTALSEDDIKSEKILPCCCYPESDIAVVI